MSFKPTYTPEQFQELHSVAQHAYVTALDSRIDAIHQLTLELLDRGRALREEAAALRPHLKPVASDKEKGEYWAEILFNLKKESEVQK